MDSKDESKEIVVKSRMCHYYDNIIKFEGFSLDNNVIDEKSYQNVSVCQTSYKNMIAKPLIIRFNKIDIFIRVYDETRYLVLFGSGKYDYVYDRIRYFISAKTGVTFPLKKFLPN